MFRPVLISLLLLATGCGGASYCERASEIAESCGETLDVASCEASLEGCTAEDEDKLTAFSDCVGECDGDGQDLGDIGALLLCTSKLSGLSETCEAGGAELTLGGTSGE
ncbi:MAG TPA: hypothetical protein ENK18_25980 [Deltaproteobacteria bacterium]|nr:hypothetical protein [Deltaproteobacteria bacterium]